MPVCGGPRSVPEARLLLRVPRQAGLTVSLRVHWHRFFVDGADKGCTARRSCWTPPRSALPRAAADSESSTPTLTASQSGLRGSVRRKDAARRHVERALTQPSRGLAVWPTALQQVTTGEGVRGRSRLTRGACPPPDWTSCPLATPVDGTASRLRNEPKPSSAPRPSEQSPAVGWAAAVGCPSGQGHALAPRRSVTPVTCRDPCLDAGALAPRDSSSVTPDVGSSVQRGRRPPLPQPCRPREVAVTSVNTGRPPPGARGSPAWLSSPGTPALGTL